jgi:tetratricopeptide (TPR) repeat protein
MSEPGRAMPACPNLETLSAYVDGTVDRPERDAIETHLTACEECYDLVVETAHAVDQTQAAGRSEVAVVPSRRRVYATIGLLAAAAGLILAVRLGLPGRQAVGLEPALASLVAAVGPERLIEPRLTGGFQFGPLRSPVRGTPDAANLALSVALADAAAAARSTPGPATHRAAGIAQLLAGQHDAAIATLEAACREQGADSGCEADLGAAYFASASSTGSATELDAAAAHTRRALALQPDLREAAFNEALILERKDLRGEAKAAWLRYLTLDPDSAWADEARRHRARLGD